MSVQRLDGSTELAERPSAPPRSRGEDRLGFDNKSEMHPQELIWYLCLKRWNIQ
ncbi:hypothetical protein CKA32_000901 [Geitlerinema sp. FC II]|nr:hypothetical protein CKA32_000901 [Geitlerinema sp. FC II]